MRNGFHNSEDIKDIDFSDFGSDEFCKRLNLNNNFDFENINFEDYPINLDNKNKSDELSFTFIDCNNIHNIQFHEVIHRITLMTTSAEKLLSIKEIDNLILKYYDSDRLQDIINSIKHIKIKQIEIFYCDIIDFHIFENTKISNLKISRDCDILSIEGIEDLDIPIDISFDKKHYDWILPIKNNINSFKSKTKIPSKRKDELIIKTKYFYNTFTTKEIIEYDLSNFAKLNEFLKSIKSERRATFIKIDFKKHKINLNYFTEVVFENCKNLNYIENIDSIRNITIIGSCSGKFPKNSTLNNLEVKNMSAKDLDKAFKMIKNAKIEFLYLCNCRITNLDLLSQIEIKDLDVCELNKITSFENISKIKFLATFAMELRYKYEQIDPKLEHLPNNIEFRYLY